MTYMKTPHWVRNAYKSTDVHWGKTQTQIMQMLAELGIEQIRFTSLPDRFALEFVAKESEHSIPRGVRIVVPLKTNPSDYPKKRNNELNTIHRILLNHLKAKFVAIGTGVTEFEQEFMAHLMIKDKQGNSTTLGETLLPQYRKAMEGDDQDIKLLGDGK